MGFHVRFKSKEEYLEVFKKLQDNGYLGEEIVVGTYMPDSIDIEDAKELTVIDKRKHRYNPSGGYYENIKKLPFVDKNDYIIMESPFRESDITALSIDVYEDSGDTGRLLKEFSELFGKDNVIVGLQTEHDDEEGDIAITIVKPEDVIDEIHKMIEKKKKQ